VPGGRGPGLRLGRRRVDHRVLDAGLACLFGLISLENRLRFHREALDAIRAVWPERFPLTMRFGSDDFNEAGVQFDDAVWAAGVLKQHGLDLADLSLGMNTDNIRDVPFNEVAFMVERGSRVRREVGIPVGVSWNLGLPAVADRVIRQDDGGARSGICRQRGAFR
jgi:2,4-dienoyl-CoA reductase-like NADH-dependent reductase (Old Yellow Enzyme family)